MPALFCHFEHPTARRFTKLGASSKKRNYACIACREVVKDASSSGNCS